MMEIVLLIAFIGIGIMVYYLVDRMGAFFDENADRINHMYVCNQFSQFKADNKTKLIHLGFDAPYLAEDFISKVEKNDQHQHLMELIVYTGSKEEMMEMLLTGELDYVILSSPTGIYDRKKVKCKEIVLQPRSLRTNADRQPIEMISHTAMKASAFWIPGWINKEKEYFSNLVIHLNG